MSRSSLLTALLLVALCGSITNGQQQPPPGPGAAAGNQPAAPPGPVIVEATVKSVEIKGRVRKLTVTSATGDELEITITPKIRFEVHAKGDSGFVRPGQMFQAEGVQTNKRLFVGNANIYLLPKGRKPIPGKMEKAPRQVGESTETYQISGPVVAVQQDSNYPDYTAVALRTNGASSPILLEKNYTVTVISDNIESVAEGMVAEVEGLPGPNGRFIVGRVTVQIPDELKADDVLGPLEELEKK